MHTNARSFSSGLLVLTPCPEDDERDSESKTETNKKDSGSKTETKKGGDSSKEDDKKADGEKKVSLANDTRRLLSYGMSTTSR